jgi:hypothetical protein
VERCAVDYVRRLEEREEGGTPDIMGDLRAGVAFLVKEMIGPERILHHETGLAAAALLRLARNPRIQVLGPLADVPRLPILSFNVEGLHHDLVSTLLDQLFGIQNRAGCACAGPYGHRLLHIGPERSERFRALISGGLTGMKPGWVRLSLPYYASAEDVDFMLSAVELIAGCGDAFVPAYELGWRDGVWRNRRNPVSDVRPIELTVEALEEAAGCFAAGDHEQPMSELQLRAERARYFEEARQHVAEERARAARAPVRWNPPTGVDEIDALVWFKYVHADDGWSALFETRGLPPEPSQPVPATEGTTARVL